MTDISERSAEWVSTQMTIFNDGWEALREIQPFISGLPDDKIQDLFRLAPSVPSVLQRFESVEKATTKIDWAQLEPWINAAQCHLRKEFELASRFCELCQIDVSNLGLDDAAKKLEESPVFLLVRREFGPNCQTRWAEVLRTLGLGFDPNSSNGIRMDSRQFWNSVRVREEKVLEEFAKLKPKQKDLETFRKNWHKLHTGARMQMLQAHGLTQTPNSDIYAYFRDLKDNQRLLPSELNYVDLAEGDNLPSLLETRRELPPQEFLLRDSRYLMLEVWAGRKKPILVEDVALLSFEDESNGATGTYRVYGDVVSEISPGQCNKAALDPKARSPTALFWQLQAQQEIYGVLGKLTERIVDATITEVEHGRLIQCHARNAERFPLVARSNRLQYVYRYNMSVAMGDLKVLVKTSLDEAMDDLWQTRQEAEIWRSRLGQLAKNRGPEELLRMLFARIDAFDTLYHHIEATSQQAEATLSTGPGDDERGMKIVVSLYNAFLTMFEERLVHFQAIGLPRQGSLSDIGRNLLEMIRENDPTLRVMGFPAVMRTLDREIEESNAAMPLAVSQMLSDLHVLIVCLQETDTHLRRFPNWAWLSQQVDLFTETWRNKPRPWLSILNKALEGPLNAKAGHSAFWGSVDMQIGKASQSDDILKDIFNETWRKMPLDRENVAAEAAQVSSISSFCMAPETVTASQRNRARGKRRSDHTTKPENSSRPPNHGLPSGRPQVDLPRIKPRKPEFWLSLRNDSKGIVSWNAFCRAMGEIGCSMENNGGSAVRFECKDSKGKHIFSIQFHKPHGKAHETSLGTRQAHRWWLKRLEQRITLDLAPGLVS